MDIKNYFAVGAICVGGVAFGLGLYERHLFVALARPRLTERTFPMPLPNPSTRDVRTLGLQAARDTTRIREGIRSQPIALRSVKLAAWYLDNPGLTATVTMAWIQKRVSPILSELELSDAERSAVEGVLIICGPVLQSRFEPDTIDLTTNPKLTGKIDQTIVRELKDNLASVVGKEIAQRIVTELCALPLRDVADQVAVASVYAGETLSVTQYSALLQTLGEANNSPPDQRASLQDVNWVDVTDRASAFLTSAQVNTLRAIMKRSEYGAAYTKQTGKPAPPMPGL
jgi:hypothetical protein